MLANPSQTAPARAGAILAAAEKAICAIPPAFPLDATVAVNPFLGQVDEDLAHAAARLERVAGVRPTLPRARYAAMIAGGQIGDEDLSDALAACRSPLRPGSADRLKAVAATDAPAPAALPTGRRTRRRRDGDRLARHPGPQLRALGIGPFRPRGRRSGRRRRARAPSRPGGNGPRTT
jgi:hypothetical protein